MAPAQAAEDAMYIQGFVDEMCGEKESVVFYIDNHGALKPACNPVFHYRPNNTGIYHHFICKAVENGHVHKAKQIFLWKD
jgi:hypothetical protein